jgi:serine/threonine protein kinase
LVRNFYIEKSNLAHSKNIVHRDIKTDNILIDEQGNVKLSDFSIACIFEKEDKFSKTDGNLYFYPPECCVEGKKIFACKPIDVWAIGVTIYVAAFKKLPFLPQTPSNVLELFRIIEAAK